MAEAGTNERIQLSPRHRHILKTLADTLLPASVGFPIAADDANLVIPIEKLFEPLGKRGFAGIGSFLVFFEWAALIFIPRFKPFTRLSPEDREKYLRGWQTSRIKYRRMIMLSLKALICLVFFSDPKVKAAVGYDTECLVELK